MWDWVRRARMRQVLKREARRERRMTRWLKCHPERIKVDARRMKEWNRNREH